MNVGLERIMKETAMEVRPRHVPGNAEEYEGTLRAAAVRTRYVPNISKTTALLINRSARLKCSLFLMLKEVKKISNFVESQPTLRRNMSPPSSGSKNKPSRKKKPA
jgi:hypothetical protein